MVKVTELAFGVGCLFIALPESRQPFSSRFFMSVNCPSFSLDARTCSNLRVPLPGNERSARKPVHNVPRSDAVMQVSLMGSQA